MSAFIVSRGEIRYLIEAGLAFGQDSPMQWSKGHQSEQMAQLAHKNATEVGQLLWEENIRSVLYRYSDCTRDNLPGPNGEDFEYEHIFVTPPPLRLALSSFASVHAKFRGSYIDPVQVLKACDCFEYQACEGSAWLDSEARQFLDALRHRAIRRLSGYQEAEWGAPKSFELNEKSRAS